MSAPRSQPPPRGAGTPAAAAQPVPEDFRRLLAAAPVVFFALDLEGRFLFGDGLLLRRLGLAPDEWVGRSVFEVYAGNDEVLANARRALAGEEFTALTRAGERAYETRWAVMHDGEGERIGTLSVSTDVTARERALAAAQAGEQRLRGLAENSAELIVEFDQRGLLHWASPNSARVFGVSSAGLLGTGMLDRIHPEDRDAVLGAVGDARAERGSATFRARDGRGGWRWLEAHGNAYRDAKGRPRGVAVLRDVTAHRELQEALERQVRFEHGLSAVSRRFLAPGAASLEDRISGALGDAAKSAGADRAVLMTFSRREPYIELHSWERHGMGPRPLRSDVIGRFAWSDAQLRAGHPIRVARLADLPPEAEPERADLARRGVRSLLGVPLRAGDKLSGYLAFECSHHERHWSDSDVQLLRLVGEVVSSAVGRNAAEARLRENEARLRALVENSPDMISEHDASGRVLFASSNVRQFVGPGGAPEGEQAWEAIHPEDRAAFGKAIAAAVRGDPVAIAEIRYRHASGCWRWAEASARVFRTNAGEPRLVLSTRDVHDRREMEHALARQLAVEETLLELSRRFLEMPGPELAGGVREALATAARMGEAERVHLFHMDPETNALLRVDSWEEPGHEGPPMRSDPEVIASCRFSGRRYARGEAFHVPRTEALPDEAATERGIMLGRGVRSYLGLPVVGEGTFIGFVGFERTRESDGWGERDIAHMRLLSEIFGSALRRLRHDETLARQVALEQLLTEIARRFLGLGAEELGGAVEGALAEVAERLEVDRAQLVYSGRAEGEPDDELFEWSRRGTPPAGAALGSDWLRARLAAGQLVHAGTPAELPAEAAAERADLERRGVQGMIAIPILAGGPASGALRFERARRGGRFSAIELPMLRLLAEVFASAFRRRSVERALRRSQDRLNESQKMDAVGRLAGGIAHDFNNLLMVITNHSELLLEGLPADDPRREDLREVQSAADRAASLTRRLLTFSRRQPAQRRRVSLNDVVGGIVEMLRRLLGEDVQVDLDLARASTVVSGDPHQLEQVVLNLALNGRDAMPRGGRLRIATEVRAVSPAEARRAGLAAGGTMVLLSVADEGEGMDEPTLRRAFEPFFTTKDPGKGTGLGLSIVYGAVQQSSGGIALDSAPGRGTRVTVYLPAANGPAEAEESRAERAAERGDETVLVVEDESAVRRIVRRSLESAGYRVLEARDGHEALELAARFEGELDLLLTDVVMPRLGGVELARELWRRQPELPVVFVSGYARGEDPDDVSFARGSFLEKPFTAAALLGAVRDALGREAKG